MKQLQTLFVATLTVIAAASASAGNSIGVNFVNNNGRGVINTSANSLAPTDSAGAPDFVQANWNNLGQKGDTLTDGVTLTNSAGAATVLSIEWDAPGNFENTGATGLATPDGKMMGSGVNRGWDNTWPDVGPVGTNVYNSIYGNKPLVYVGGLNAWMASEGAEGYSVIVYVSSAGAYWDNNTHWIQSVSGSPFTGTMVGGADLSPHKTIVNGFTFGGAYQEIKGTGDGMDWGQDWGANYAAFRGLTNDAVLIRSADTSDQWGVVPLDGFQIVPQFPQLPVVQDPTFVPASTVYAGVPVTVTEVATPDPIHTNLWYRWQSDNASGGVTFTDIPNATNSTYTFTPTNSPTQYTLQFKVIVTNVFGSVTSGTATLTVNPAVAPFVVVDTQPGAGSIPAVASIYTYVGGSVSFTNAYDGTRPISTKWQADKGSGYADIPGSTSQSAQPSYVGTSVTVANLQLSDSGNYRGYATNNFGDVTSTPTPIVVQADPAAPDSSQAYPYDVFTNGPIAYWRLNETLDNANNYVQAYDYSGNGHNARYGSGAYDNQAGPQSPQFVGFESLNTGISLINNLANSSLTVPSLNLNTNAVTISAWINPSGAVGAFWGLFTWANGSDKAGFGFGGTVVGGVAELGYVWNTNSPATYNYHSGLYPPLGQWSFVTLTITPTNSTIYLYYIDQNTSKTNLLKSVQTINNSVETFNGGTIWIGSDSGPNRNFNGSIDEVAVFNKSLSEAQVQDLFLKAIGATCIAPNVTDASIYPVASVYSGQNVRLTANVSGTSLPSMKWQSSPDSSTWTDIPGATSSSVVVNPQTVGTVYYHLIAMNDCGTGSNNAVAVTFNALPATPAGLWTVNYQVTNTVLNYSGTTSGLGHYEGRGILGSGSHWNVVPHTNGTGYVYFLTSASDILDDGATHSGINCSIYQCGAFSFASANQPDSSDVGNLLQQWVNIYQVTNSLVFGGMPDGTYNLCFYACDGGWGDRGTSFRAHGVNGDQVGGTTNALPILPLQQSVNFVLMTNVHVVGGTLNVDVFPTSPVPTHDPNGETDFNGAQLQLVSYDPVTAGFSGTPTNVFVTQPVTFADASTGGTNWLWDFGDGNTLSAQTRGASHAYAAPGTYTVSQIVKGPLGTAGVTNVSYIVVSPRPAIGSATVSNGKFVLSGTDGIAGAQYRVLTSTNLTLPLGSWTPVATNVFANDHSYSYTNSSPTNNAFFILVAP